MSLVYAAITPHTPLLLPTVAKEQFGKLEATVAALRKIEQDLYVTKPRTLVILTPHGEPLEDALTIHLHSAYTSNFEDFGDLTTKKTWKPDTQLIGRLREDMKRKRAPISMDTNDHLDYGCSIPLLYVTEHLPDIRIVPIVTSHLDVKTHFDIGRILKDEIMATQARIAVIASADLSHKVSTASPAGYSPQGPAFDARIQKLLTNKNPQGILEMTPLMLDEAEACGTAPLATLFGLLDGIRYETDILSYEAPFGIGYLTASMRFA